MLRAIPFALLQEELPRRDGIGTAHEAVTTSSSEAQRWYDEGLAHLYSFSWIDAARAFNAALRLDSHLAMAHLGLSFAFGGLGSLRGANDEWQRARDLESGASERDRVRIRLRFLQLSALADPDGAASRREYISALDRALQTDPRDVELLLLRGEAEAGSGGAPSMSSGASAIRFYEQARQAAPQAFAPHHYLAHAYENSGQIALAVRESGMYTRIAPAVAHAHHMLGHGLLRSELAIEAIAEFRKAVDLEAIQSKAGHMSPEYDWHHHHNASLLAASYRYVGQMRAAADLLRSTFLVAAPLLPEELDKRQWPAFLLAQGALTDALKAAQQLTAHASPIVRAAGHLSAAHAHMTSAQLQPAALETDAALAELRTAGPDAAVLAPDLRLAQGELFLRGGDRQRGRQMIRDAIASLRARPGPDAWTETLFTLEAVARAARSVGNAEISTELAEQLRQHDPSYAGTHFALALEAERARNRTAALRAYEEALRRWRHADPDLADVAYARAHVATLRQPR
jgi:tetratricopeptide (TPR) repeat protein